MSTFRFHALAIAIAAITLILPQLARAADTPAADAVGATDGDAPIRALDAVQVQGSLLGRSKPDDVQRYAGSRQVIDREQLRNGGNRSLDDALQRVPGIKIFDETGTGALPQIMLRGLYESRSGRVQVLEDGHSAGIGTLWADQPVAVSGGVESDRPHRHRTRRCSCAVRAE